VMEFVLAIAKPSAAKKVAVVNTATAMARRRNMAGSTSGRFLLLMPVSGMKAVDPKSRLASVRRRTW